MGVWARTEENPKKRTAGRVPESSPSTLRRRRASTLAGFQPIPARAGRPGCRVASRRGETSDPPACWPRPQAHEHTSAFAALCRSFGHRWQWSRRRRTRLRLLPRGGIFAALRPSQARCVREGGEVKRGCGAALWRFLGVAGSSLQRCLAPPAARAKHARVGPPTRRLSQIAMHLAALLWSLDRHASPTIFDSGSRRASRVRRVSLNSYVASGLVMRIGRWFSI